MYLLKQNAEPGGNIQSIRNQAHNKLKSPPKYILETWILFTIQYHITGPDKYFTLR